MSEKFEQNNPVIEIPETERKNVLAKFFKKHLGFIVLTTLLASAPEQIAFANEQKSSQTPETGASQNEQGSLEVQRKATFEKFKALVENEDIEGVLAELREAFGPALDSFLSMHRIDRDLDSLKRLDGVRNDDGAFVNKNTPIAMTQGSIVSASFKERWEHHAHIEKDIILKNIDKVPNFSEEEFLAFLKSTYPARYISGNISTIEFVAQNDIRGGSEILGQAENFSMDSLARSVDGDRRAPIRINLPTTGIDRETFLEIFTHEAGHPADWNNNPNLTSGERILMLRDVLKRVKSESRYKSEYVENIKMDDISTHFGGEVKSDKEKGQYLDFIHATEYWAEISAQYFKSPEKFQQDHPEDFSLVKKWVEATIR